MIDVKCNFKSYYGQDLKCKLCPEEETLPHLLVCKETVDTIDTSNYSYHDVFEDLEKQEAITKMYIQILKLRTMKLKMLRNL